MDLTEGMMNEGRRLCDQRGITNVHFLNGDAMAIPFPDQHFDIVVCRRAAHHFRDARKAVAEMARVVRRSGYIVIDQS